MGTIQIPSSAETYAVEGNQTIAGSQTIAGTLAVIGAQTNTAGVQAAAVAVIATATGATTGTIPDGASVCTVTVATDANDIVVLPTPTPGNIVWLLSAAVAFELRSSAPSTVLINGGTGGAAVESAVANTDYVTRCVCMDATHWIVTHFAADGTESAGDAAA